MPVLCFDVDACVIGIMHVHVRVPIATYTYLFSFCIGRSGCVRTYKCFADKHDAGVFVEMETL